MGEYITKNKHRSKRHKDRISSKKEDISFLNVNIPSDPSFTEKNIKSSVSVANQKTESDNLSLSFLFSSDLDETELKEKEIDLYNDLVLLEDSEKKSKTEHEAEVESLKRELEKLKEADACKSTKISELMKENSNLKKSISSLYITVKSEIEHKDQMLAEANRKIDNILFRKNGQHFRNDRGSKSQSNNDTDTSDKNISHKRKRSAENLEISAVNKRNASNAVKTKNSNSTSNKYSKYDAERTNNQSDDVNSKSIKNACNERTKVPTLENMNFSEISRDSTETNNLFFSLIPSPLKKAFYEYEQGQIISLNRLKQSFINEYFKSENNLTSTGFPFNAKKFKSQELETYKEKNIKVTRSLQQDLVSLFKYKKERIPFLDKRKFGLLKEGKDLIPENLL